MWICAWHGCTFWKTFKEIDVEGNVKYGTSIIFAYVEEAFVDNESEDFLSPQVPLPEFWARVRPEMAIPDKDTARVLQAQMKVPMCSCGNPSRVALCRVTGDLFWLCATETCYQVDFCNGL